MPLSLSGLSRWMEHVISLRWVKLLRTGTASLIALYMTRLIFLLREDGPPTTPETINRMASTGNILPSHFSPSSRRPSYPSVSVTRRPSLPRCLPTLDFSFDILAWRSTRSSRILGPSRIGTVGGLLNQDSSRSFSQCVAYRKRELSGHVVL